MLIAHRNGMLAGGYTARDYVSDGLVAMWDGIENAGRGVHDPNATTWKDLVGSMNLTINTSLGEWAINNLHGLSNVRQTYSSASADLTTAVASVINSGIFTLEEVIGTSSACSTYGGGSNITASGSETNRNRYTDYRSASSPYDQIRVRLQVVKDGQTYNSYSGFVPHTVHMSGFVVNGTSTRPILDGAVTGDTINSISGDNLDNLKVDATTDTYNIRLYSRALTAEEIARNYAIDKARFNLP